MPRDSPVVLIVDDQGVVADVYAELLGEEYECQVVYSGEAAIEAYGPHVDVVLLDRRIPDIPGDEVLTALRGKAGDSRITMVTAVQPDFDVLDMGFHDYLVKPVTPEALRGTVAKLVELSAYSTGVKRYYALASKRACLETEKSPGELAENTDYQRLLEELSTLESRLERTVCAFSAVDYNDAFRDIQSEGMT